MPNSGLWAEELLCQDTLAGTIKGVGRVYLHAVVDTFSSYAFGFLHTTKLPEAAVAVLHNEFPLFGKKIFRCGPSWNNGRELCGSPTHPYELYLALNEGEHPRTEVRKPQTNSFVERFNRTVLDEFSRQAFRTRIYESLTALQEDLDAWLQYYNHERPHQGYRNMGAAPSIPSTCFSEISKRYLVIQIIELCIYIKSLLSFSL